MPMNIYEFSDYREFLKQTLSSSSEKKFSRKLLASHLRCQSSYISQVLTGRTDLSMEYAFRTANYVSLSKDETEYFLLLVQKEKAGDYDLKNFFGEKIKNCQKSNLQIKNRVRVKDSLSIEDQARYYSDWWYAAIHILSSLPDINSESDVIEYLGLPRNIVKETLEFLNNCGLINYTEDGLSIGNRRIHIDTSSPMISSHHKNWRTNCLQHIDKFNSNNIHYTGVLGLSQTDILKIKTLLLDMVEKAEPIIRDSVDEKISILNVDFYQLGN